MELETKPHLPHLPSPSTAHGKDAPLVRALLRVRLMLPLLLAKVCCQLGRCYHCNMTSAVVAQQR